MRASTDPIFEPDHDDQNGSDTQTSIVDRFGSPHLGQRVLDTHKPPAEVTVLPVDPDMHETHEHHVDGHPPHPGQDLVDNHDTSAGVPSLPVDHHVVNTQKDDVDGHPRHPHPDQDLDDAQTVDVGVDHLFDDQSGTETHRSYVVEHHPDQRYDDTQERTVGVPLVLDDQSETDTQATHVVEHCSAEPGQGSVHTHGQLAGSAPTPSDPDFALLLYADVLDDLEHTRNANANRLESLHRVKGLEDTPEAAKLAGLVDGLAALEHQAILNLQRAMRTHPLGPWIKASIGIGEKQGARLLAAIGNPADRHTVSQLWAYCGLHVLHPGQGTDDPHSGFAGVDVLSSPGPASPDTHQVRVGAAHSSHLDQSLNDGHAQLVEVDTSDPGQANHDAHVSVAGVAPARRRGMRANWNGTARQRVWLCAESCVKQLRKPCERPDDAPAAIHVPDCACSPYRLVYDNGRTKYADAVHPVECVRCGPRGKPAPVGSPLSAKHQQARAYRLVMKAILRDLWCEARRLETAGR